MRRARRKAMERFKNRKVAAGFLLGVMVVLIGAAVGIVLSVNVTPDGTIEITPAPEPDIMVEVRGEVESPGVYPLASGEDRVSDLIRVAGGRTDFADLEQLNLAMLVEDGQVVVVPRRCFDINAISEEEFDLFPGVGPATASAIVSHRRSEGEFATVDELTNVRGIGAATLARIEETVCLEVPGQDRRPAMPPREPDIMVEVKGEVMNPAVYPLVSGVSRISDLIAAAGGATDFADLDQLNLAMLVEEGQSVEVPRRCFNINVITEEEFELFPRIGPATASAIVSHRRSEGDFATVEELTNVRGIGDATLATIREAVCLVVPGQEMQPLMPPQEADIQVEVRGEVVNPGAYDLASGEGRVSDLIAAAGGATDFADLEQLNLAMVVEDGQVVEVPRRCFNINTITEEEFDLFPRIGPVTAGNIVSHRRSEGDFATVEDLTNVRGIGDATLATIQEMVCLVVE